MRNLAKHNFTKWYVGQTVYYVPYDNRNRCRTLVINNIGRTLCHTSTGEKFEINGGGMRNGEYGNSGRVFADQQHYQERQAAQTLWHALKNRLPNNCPETMDAADVEHIAKLLGIGLAPGH